MEVKIKQENQFNLLKGVFSGAETREVLTSLYKDKIRFHILKSFSNEERFGKPDPRAEERIPELKKTLEEILDFLKQFDELNQFEIYADIQIKLVQ